MHGPRPAAAAHGRPPAPAASSSPLPPSLPPSPSLGIKLRCGASWQEGGLKPKERRAALLLVFTWAMYVAGGASGSVLAYQFDWSLSPVSGRERAGEGPACGANR